MLILAGTNDVMHGKSEGAVDRYKQLIDENLAAGNVSDNIINQKGSTLPSTGGIGTTLFVVGGGVTAAAAAIYLVSKKRAKDAE